MKDSHGRSGRTLPSEFDQRRSVLDRAAAYKTGWISRLSTPDVGSASITITAGGTVAMGPPSVSIDFPGNNSTVSGTVAVQGWAMDNTSAVGSATNSVQVKVDGVVVGTATYGASRTDVCTAFPGPAGMSQRGLLVPAEPPGSARVRTRSPSRPAMPDTTLDVGSASITIIH